MKLCTVFIQESVESSDVTVDVSLPSSYIASRDISVPSTHIANSVDGFVACSAAASASINNIHPSDVLISCNTNSTEEALEQASPASLAVDLTASSELATFKAETSR